MTVKQRIDLQKDPGRLILWDVGLFCSAVEQGAYALCLAKGLRPVRKRLKGLPDGYVMAGFPKKDERKFLDGFTAASSPSEDCRTFICDPVEQTAFLEWKRSLPYSDEEKKTEKGRSGKTPEFSDGERRALSRIRSFDLAVSTPLDCMMLVRDCKTDIGNG